MLSTLEIVLIIVIIVSIILIVYIKINNQPINNQPKMDSDTLIKNTPIVLGIKTTDGKEKFANNVLFKTLDDITQNMIEYLKYAAPTIDMNDINSLLIKNGLNKTADTIFKEHKELDSIKFIKKFKIQTIISLNTLNSYKNTDNQEIEKYYKSNDIILVDYINKIFQKYINSGNKDDSNMYSTGKYTITFIDLIINNDYMTSDRLIIYYRTSNNTNIPFSDAVEKEHDVDFECYSPNKLCKTTTKKYSEFINVHKEIVRSMLEDNEKLIKLLIVKYLFELNKIDNNGDLIASSIEVPSNILTDIDTIRNRNNYIGIDF